MSEELKPVVRRAFVWKTGWISPQDHKALLDDFVSRSPFLRAIQKERDEMAAYWKKESPKK